MKTNLLILSFLLNIFLNNWVNAQEFAPNNAYWYFTESYSFSGNEGFIYGFVSNDTTINGKLCKTIILDGSCKPANNRYVYQSGDSVFLYHQFLDTFQLLYAFNAQKGDSWKFINLSDSNANDTVLVTITVDSAYSVNFNSNNLKAIDVTYETAFPNMNPYIEKSTIVERIGDFNYLFNYYESSVICDVNHPVGLRCYYDPSIGLVKLSDVACDFVSVEEKEENEIKIFPNPVKDFLTINTNLQELIEIEIINVIGNQVFKSSIIGKNPNYYVDLNHLPSGMYFLQLKSKNQIYSGRIVKQ